MANRKIYFTEENSEAELEAFMNTDGKLFVSLTEKDIMHNVNFIALDREDAIELISELAYQFNLVRDDSMDSGHYFWVGKNSL